jgi:glycosyltransferase involved in cell wall biosynthesis
MKKVLVITYYWPPAGGGGVQRVAKFCRYLGAFGWEPVVLTAQESGFAQLDPSLNADIEGVRGVYRAADRMSLGALRRALSGRKSPTAGAKVSSRRPRRSRLVQLLAEWVRLNLFIPDSRVGWLGPALRRGEEIIRREAPSLIFSSAPPYTAHLVAMRLKQRTGLPWIADFRDPWMENHTYNTVPRLGVVKWRTRRLEHRVLDEADRVVSVGRTLSSLLSSKLPPARKDRCVTITNGYDQADVLPVAAAPDRFRLSYFGTIYDDGFPSTLLRALQELSAEDDSFARDFLLQITGHLSAGIHQLISEALSPANLSVNPYLPHRQMLTDLYRPQLLILLVNRIPTNRLIITGKLLDYLPTGNPVLGIGPVEGDAAAILAETQTGTLFDYEDLAGVKRFVRDQYARWRTGTLNTGAKALPAYERKTLTGQLAGVFDETVGS